MKKNRKLFLIFTTLVGIFVSYFMWNNWNENQYSKAVFGINLKSEKELLDFNQIKGVFGDGFSIEVLKMNDQEKKHFSNLTPEFFENYPLKRILKDKYSIHKWTETPQKKEDIVITKVATMNHREVKWRSEDKNRSIENYLKYTNTLLNSKGNFYAMNFSGTVNMKDKVDEVKGIDLYVVSPQNGIIVKIYRQ
ncbi:MAG: hypothetical protein JXR48_00065 [Candidatus Delongbacteria bacterium]|nr:hypothetical protein [Candidatus Delongbacteria bacterium]